MLKVEQRDETVEVEVGVMSFADGRRRHKPGNRGDILNLQKTGEKIPLGSPKGRSNDTFTF